MPWLDDISTFFADAKKEWSGALDQIEQLRAPNDQKFDKELAIPSARRTLSEIDAAVLALSGFIKPLLKSKNLNLAPQGTLDGFANSLENLRAAAIAISNGLKVIPDQGGCSGIDSNAFSVVTAAGQTIPLAPLLEDFDIKLEAVLLSYYSLSGMLGGKTGDAFAEVLESLTQTLAEARTATNTLRTNSKQSSDAAAQAGSYAKTAGDDAKAAQESLKNIEATSTEVAGHQEPMNKLVDEVGNIAEQAQTVKMTVDEYRVAFEEFQRTLDLKNSEFGEWKTNIDNLGPILAARDKTIEDLNKKADAMLSHATNAGLAGTFQEIEEKLEIEVNSARSSFNRAIAFLVLLSAPLLAYLIVIVLGVLGINFGASTLPSKINLDPVTTGLLVLFLVPGIWLSRFAASRHHLLFNLKEHYKYKYSVAMSVEGFKLQSEGYEKEIAAASYFALTFNPADKMSGKGAVDGPPNPILKKFMDKLGLTADGSQN